MPGSMRERQDVSGHIWRYFQFSVLSSQFSVEDPSYVTPQARAGA
jgi:hypothetical protein